MNNTISGFFNYELFARENFSLTVSSIFTIVAIGLACWIFLMSVAKLLNRVQRFNEGQKFTLITVIKYLLYLFYVVITLRLLGIDVSMLLASSAALFIGIGLGLQGLFYDFISGIILLIDGSIKVGNVIQVGDKRVEVIAIHFRTSLVKTREEKEIIIPNSWLTKNEIINWSNQKNVNRHYITVQVHGADVIEAMKILVDCSKKHPKVISHPEPYARIEEFESYSVTLKLLFWSNEVQAVGRMLGDLRLSVLQEFQANGIKMPYPQQVVTLEK
ncbi:MAG: mechanosensitive ion channel [Saprospiraceae bacterium]|nr:mechanosensitive ion channel [Saprospiraceae bacterium]